MKYSGHHIFTDNGGGTLYGNYVYQILKESYDGDFFLFAYNFEKNAENADDLLNTKKKLYFRRNKVCKLITDHEFYRTKNFEWVYEVECYI